MHSHVLNMRLAKGIAVKGAFSVETTLITKAFLHLYSCTVTTTHEDAADLSNAKS